MTTPVPVRTARGFGITAVTPHELSTQAALEVMKSGGNAVDGAIAANAVQGVVAPETCGVGGDLFALVHVPGTMAPSCLNASGRAGSGANASTLRDRGYMTMPIYGRATITVPGCVDGWYVLVDRFGSLPSHRCWNQPSDLPRKDSRPRRNSRLHGPGTRSVSEPSLRPRRCFQKGIPRQSAN